MIWALLLLKNEIEFEYRNGRYWDSFECQKEELKENTSFKEIVLLFHETFVLLRLDHMLF